MELFEPLALQHGPTLANRLVLAPLTNLQSHDDGRLSDDEFRWLTRRALGGFALTMTCAAHVQAQGRGFPGQLGVFSDLHVEGLTRLARAIRGAGSVAVVQLHHAGMRSPPALIGTAPVCPSEDTDTGARALSLAEVEQLTEDFIAAAKRAERAGFDGIELHCAHGYMLCEFLSPEFNRRTDRYGGSPENRSRIIDDILLGIRARCRPDFIVGVRLSPERFGLRLADIRQLAERLMQTGAIDYLDLSLWDVCKEPEEAAYRGRSLMSYFTELDRRQVRLGAAGKIRSGADAQRCLKAGLDFVVIGTAAILHADFPRRLQQDPRSAAISLPVSAEYLREAGVGPAFVGYLRSRKGFVAP